MCLFVCWLLQYDMCLQLHRYFWSDFIGLEIVDLPSVVELLYYVHGHDGEFDDTLRILIFDLKITKQDV
jgi:hypothetical protein